MVITLAGEDPIDPNAPFTFQVPSTAQEPPPIWPTMVQAELVNLKHEIEDQKKEIQQLTANQQLEDEKHERLAETLKISNRERIEAKTALKELQQLYDEGLSINKKSFVAKKQAAEMKVAALQIDLDQLKEENQALKLAHEELIVNLHSHEKNKEAFDNEYKQVVREKDDATARQIVLNNLNQNFFHENDELRKEIEGLREKNEALQEAEAKEVSESVEKISSEAKHQFEYTSVAIQCNIQPPALGVQTVKTSSTEIQQEIISAIPETQSVGTRCDFTVAVPETGSIGTQPGPIPNPNPEVRIVTVQVPCTHTYVKDAILYLIILLLSVFSLYTWNLVWRSQPGAFGFGGPAVDNTITRFHARVAQFLLDRSGGPAEIYM
jgi:hypothetical protein